MEKAADGAFHEALGSNGCKAISPKEFRNVPPREAAAGCCLPEDKGFAIPDPDTVIRLDIPAFERVDGQIELVRGMVQNMIHLDEDACAKLGGIPFVVQSINGGSA